MKELSCLFLAFMLILGSANGQEAMTSDYNKDLKKYRKNYKKALQVDERSPLESKKDAKEIGFYEPNQAFIVKCLFIGTSEARPFEMATYAGDTKPYIKHGELLFEIPGKGTHRLSVYKSLKAMKLPMYKDHLFIPFKDLTTGDTTYGGGRYIDIKQSDIAKGIINLDFNKAYNPWCAYSDGFSCPIPPAENELNIAIEAGEMSFNKEADLQKS